MIKLGQHLRQIFIEIGKSSKVFLEGSIIKLVDHENDPDFTEYLNEANRQDKSIRRKRLEITKQIQTQNRELIAAKKVLEQTLKKLEKQNKDLAEFSWMISHNLRGPVSSALGVINLLSRKGVVTPGNEDLVFHLVESTKKMDQILGDVAELLEIRDHPDELRDLSLATIVDNSCDYVDDWLKAAKGNVVLEIDNDLMIRGSEKYLQSILNNLLANSIQFRSPHRTLAVKVSVSKTDEHAVIMVEDNGKGIAREDWQKIFEPFKRLDYSSTGKGLGLYLVRTQTEAMGGEVSVFSMPDSGSVFTVKLPLSMDSVVAFSN